MPSSPRSVMPFELYGADRSSAGRYYWTVGLPDGRELSAHADEIEVMSSGALVLWRDASEDGARPRQILLSLPIASWHWAYAASVLDGSPICAERLDAPKVTE